MKKKIALFVLTAALMIPACLSAGYKEDIQKGNEAYKAQDWQAADTYYRKAYTEKPGEKLKKVIVFIESKMTKTAAKEAAKKSLKEEKPFNWGGAGLIALDTVLAAAAAYTVYDQQNSQEDYLKLYAAVNNTTDENYSLLVKKQKTAYDKMTLEVLGLSAAGVMVLYTLGDLFFTHQIFTADVSVKPVITLGYAGISAERSF